MFHDDVAQGARWWRLLPAAVVVLAPFALFWDATLGRVMLAPGDSRLVLLPNRQLVANYLLAGEWPLWNPFSFSGSPMLAVSQMAVLHPGTWLYALLPELWATNAQVIATYVAAGLGTFAYCRALGCSRFGAMIAGLTFSGSGFMLAHLGHVVLIQGAACLPAVFWCLERQRTTGEWRFVVGGAVAIALAAFAGHPQVPVMLLAAGAGYVLYFAVADPGPSGRWEFVRDATMTLAGGVLLAAVQLVPIPELAAASPRAQLTFAEFTSMAIPLRQVSTLLLPYLFGGALHDPYRGYFGFVELCGYAGLVPLMLVAAALPAALRDRTARFTVILGAIGFLFALGAQTPLAYLGYQIPVWNLFRGAARNILFANFAVAVLAGWSATHVLPRHMRSIAVGSGVVLVAVVISVWAGPPNVSRAAVFTPLVLALSGAVVLTAAARWPSTSTGVAVAVLLAADLYVFGTQMPRPVVRAEDVGVPPEPVAWLLAEGVQPETSRIAQLRAGESLPVRADLGRWGLASAMGFEPLMLSRYGEFAGGMSYFGRVPDRAVVESPLFLDLLNAEYLIVRLPEKYRVKAAGGFAPVPMGVEIGSGESLTLALPSPQAATSLDLVTYLSEAQSVEDGAAVARVLLTGPDGRVLELPVHAGRDTAEWAWARPDVAAAVRHGRGAVWEPLQTSAFVGSQYFARLTLPASTVVSSLRFENTSASATLTLMRASLRDGQATEPLTHAHALFRDEERWEIREVGKRAVLLRNRHALPRAWLVPAVQKQTPEEILSTVGTGRLPDGQRFDPLVLALVEEDVALALGPSDPAARATLVHWSPNRVDVETVSRNAAFLVLSEIFYPGWRVTVDGVRVPIARANAVLRGVAVPAGTHLVRWTFRPWLPLLGAGVSFVTILAFAIAGGRRRRRVRS